MTELIAAGLLVVSATTATLMVLRAPLVAVLIEACGLEHRARFWWRVSVTEAVMGTASCASGALALSGSPSARWWPAIALLRGGCAGLLLSVLAITVGTLAVGRAAATAPGARPG